jgi:hypothetical protein
MKYFPKLDRGVLWCDVKYYYWEKFVYKPLASPSMRTFQQQLNSSRVPKHPHTRYCLSLIHNTSSLLNRFSISKCASRPPFSLLSLPPSSRHKASAPAPLPMPMFMTAPGCRLSLSPAATEKMVCTLGVIHSSENCQTSRVLVGLA